MGWNSAKAVLIRIFLLHAADRDPAQRYPRLKRGHHGVEFCEIQRLVAVAPCLVGIGMHLDHQPIRAGGNADARQRRNQIAMAARMAWVGNHRKMCRSV